MCMLPPKKLVSSEQVDARSQTYNGSILQGTPATVEYRAFLKCLFAFTQSPCVALSLLSALQYPIKTQAAQWFSRT